MPEPATSTVEVNGFSCRVWRKGSGPTLGFLAVNVDGMQVVQPRRLDRFGQSVAVDVGERGTGEDLQIVHEARKRREK